MNRLTAASLTLSALSAMTIIGASTADAHTGRLTATTACADNGWSVTWSAHNVDATHSMTPGTPGFTPAPIPALGSGTLTQAFPASQTSASVAGYFTFDNGFTDPYSLTVVAPSNCPVTTTTVAPTTTVVTSTTVAPTSSTTPPATSSRFTVTTTAAPVPTLPETGASSAPLAAGGVVLVGLGAALVTFARKRSDES